LNALYFTLVTYTLLVVGTIGCKKWVEKIYPPDVNMVTPAISMRDGLDFEPLDLNVALGHYFMTIAGAAPIVAAILGMMWGWLPATIYLVFAVTFLGSPSEFTTLMFSLRNKAASLGTVCRDKIGEATGTYISIILFFVCTLTYAVMGSLLCATLAKIPTAGIPTISIILVSVLFGFLRYKTKLGLTLSTVIALAIWTATIVLGIKYPLVLTENQWSIGVAIYVLIACFTPIQWLLAPRDYLNSFILVVGLALGSVALLVGHPTFNIPAFTSFETARGYLYPGIIATIGCGAINGMHAIVSMGTTPKQLKNEKEAYWITAIGTRGETVIGLMSIALIASFYNYDGFLTSVVSNPGPTFSMALGKTFSYIGISEQTGLVIGALTLTGFIITTVDGYARTGRLILGELVKKTPAEKFLGNPYIGSFMVVLIGLYLLYSSPFGELWSGFSLIAIQLTIYAYSLAILRRIEEKKAFDGHFILWVVLPGIFMLVTTIVAMVMFLVKYLNEGAWIPSVIIVALMVLTALTLLQVNNKMKILKNKEQVEAVM